ncbi:glycosyltransferase family 4 protein [Sunxiuqinia sp. sy24]|uniref:glycosyltransferase family 4 protein n=1 Tax=Sunxiuqinia sp. sy24 TaxID=3461495 RepID=UPI004045DFFA
MKILMLLENNFPPDTRVENEIHSLQEDGHEVHIACLKTKGNKKTNSFGSTVIHRFEISEFVRKSSVGALAFPFYFYFWNKRVCRLFADYKYDAIHVHDLPLAAVGFKIKKRFGARFVLDLHENWPALLKISEHTKTFLGKLLFSVRQWKAYEKKYLFRADEVIVVVDEAKERVVALGVDEVKVHVVSNTQNLEEFAFESHLKPDSKIRFVYGGGVTYHRGLQYVLQAAARVQSGNFEIRIVGAGRYLRKLQELTRELNIENNVCFYGWRDRQELLKLIAESDVALIPHVKSDHTDTTIPHKLFQYLYTEKPILASNCRPIERIIKETCGGWIYPFSDINQLAGVMQQIIDGGYDLDAFAKGRPLVVEKYNWDKDKLKLQAIYHE